ncbi:MAG: hypothetical protein JW913_03375 [Chitinispirillaceae bacterium]|nr:hypothetical protein [Chitinispirillaceae bacterium]
MKRILSCLFCVVNASYLFAQTVYPSGACETGVGARAYALSNNHTALSSGVSDLYWNPAALSFSVSREFQISLYGMKLSSMSQFSGNESPDNLQRFRFGNAGFSFALPTTRGGISIAGSYSNPVILDDVFRFSGPTGNNTSVERIYRATGNLNYWTTGFGLQIVKNLGIGLAASFVNGRSTAEPYYLVNDYNLFTSVSPTDDYTSDGKYFGYDIRAGVFYKSKMIHAGMRIVAPQVIRHIDYLNGVYDDFPIDATDKWNMYSSYRGAVGVSALFPFVTITAELRSTAPYDLLFPLEKIHSQAGEYKYGGGIGAEVPLVVLPVIFRAGYSYDNLDLHPFIYDFVTQPDNTRDFDWSDGGMEVIRNLHRLSAGLGYTTARMSFDLSYGLSTYGILTSGVNKLEQLYLLHRVLTSFAIRF